MTAQELKDFRVDELMITQEEMAELIGVTRKSLACWELGLSKPRMKNKRKISNLKAAYDKNKKQ